MLRFGLALLATVVGIMSRPTLAHAAETADELYRRGVTEFRAGHYQAACRALSQSLALEALPGVLFTLATCEARAGRPATAAELYREFLNIVANSGDSARKAEQEREREQVALVERERALVRAARLEIETAVMPLDAKVFLDGSEQDPSALARALVLDPGEHTLVLLLRDGRKREQRLVLQEGERRRAVLQAPGPSSAVDERPATQAGTSPWLYVAGGAAGAGLATGVATGLLALDRKRAVDDNCRGAICNDTGKVAADTARSEALVSSVAFGVAGVGAAAFLAIWFLEPTAPKQASRGGFELGVTPTGALLRGSF